MTDSIYNQAFAAGRDFDAFLEAAQEHREMWHAIAGRTALDDTSQQRAQAISQPLRLVALADDWCGDAINTLPVAARIAEAAPGVELRIVPRDDWPELMDRHLTNGARSIPIVAIVDAAGTCLGAWGPRPAVLQQCFEETGRAMEFDDRHRELRRWYAQDRGVSTAHGLLDLLEVASISP
jgi:hypothetical protein